MNRLNKTAVMLLSVCLLSPPAISASANDYPSKPVRIIVPFPAGVSGDVRVRQLAPHLSERLKQPVIVDNRPGAAGSIGTAIGARARPDGYTLIYILSTTVAAHPHIYREIGFNPLTDLTPIIIMNKGGAILVVKADSPIQSAQDLINRARANPGKLSYGSSGPGSPQHFMGERLEKFANIDLLHVPYKGDAPTLVDLMAGQIDFAFGMPPATLPHIESGRLRALAVTQAKRLPPLPAVPTLAEAGVPDFDEILWSGFAAPAGTPDAVIKKLHQALRAAMLTPQFRSYSEKVGAEMIVSTQEQAVALVKSDYERYGKIVKELGLRVE